MWDRAQSPTGMPAKIKDAKPKTRYFWGIRLEVRKPKR